MGDLVTFADQRFTNEEVRWNSSSLKKSDTSDKLKGSDYIGVDSGVKSRCYNTTFSTAATSERLRPTDVLQGRLVKIGGQLTF